MSFADLSTFADNESLLGKFDKLKFVPEDAPRGEERKLEMLSNFPRILSLNLNKLVAWDFSTEN